MVNIFLIFYKIILYLLIINKNWLPYVKSFNELILIEMNYLDYEKAKFF
jgi:hypothetical protein